MYTKSLVIIAIFVLLIISVINFYTIRKNSIELNELTESKNNFVITLNEAINSIKTESELTTKRFQEEFSDNLSQSIDTIQETTLEEYHAKLDAINASIDKKNKEYEKIKSKTDRATYGLPEQIDLDVLYEYYIDKKKPKTRNSTLDVGGYLCNYEEFKTAKGKLTLCENEFDFATIPSSNKIAWIKMGKKSSTLNSDLIKAWLDESAKSKMKQGYKLISNQIKPSDYGKYTEKTYKKGDLYFKTYYQYERVLETYDRHSLQYNFFIEFGSSKRKEQYMLEQYNIKTGS